MDKGRPDADQGLSVLDGQSDRRSPRLRTYRT